MNDTDRHHEAELLAELLRIVGLLVDELRSQRPGTATVVPESRLDRDLGLDSLGRVELFARIERAFGVQLPERLLVEAETPHDLLLGVQTAGPAWEPPLRDERGDAPDETVGAPLRAMTLLEVLDWHVAAHPDRRHITLVGEQDEETVISYGDLRRGAERVAAGLVARGFRPGETAAIMLPTGRDYFFSFFGIILAGGVPAPVYPPAHLSRIEEHLVRHVAILGNAEATVLVTTPEVVPLARLLRTRLDRLRTVITPGEFPSSPVTVAAPLIRPQDLALLQYTSGSTGSPKGVMLTHANLLANVRAMGEAAAVSSSDVFVSWLPLYHDMGLIGAWFATLYFAAPLVIMAPLSFLSRPERWLWAIHRHRGTLSAAPNFAYELCLRKIEEQAVAGLDLSSWRMACNGAEPVSPVTAAAFVTRFSACGLRPGAMAPLYGLAECSVGLAFPPQGRGLLVDRVRRAQFVTSGQAEQATAEDADPLVFVACGRPIPRHEVRIVDRAGMPLPERREGRLQFRGPSTTAGYFRNPGETARLRDGDWLESGDLAYLVAGELYITGRVKDVVIKGGRNIYPYELEEAVGAVAGIRTGCVAVFGSPDPLTGTERLVVMAETRVRAERERERLREAIVNLAVDLIGMPPDEVALVAPNTVLKTSSGKIRRAASRERYERGGGQTRLHTVRQQFLRLGLAAASAAVGQTARRVGLQLHAAWCWLLFGLLTAVAWPAVALTRTRAASWRLCRLVARLLLRLAGIRLTVAGLQQLPAGGACVVVANHASYLDSIVLTAALPGEYAYVAKQELAGSAFTRIPLQRLGTAFVERFDLRQGVEDAARVLAVARSGRSVIFFPEGTFRRRPGLLPFRMGAFMVAVDGQLPVVPVTIVGTRALLPDGSWLPGRGEVRVSVAAPIVPAGEGWNAAIELRDAARREMLVQCGEVDLEQPP